MTGTLFDSFAIRAMGEKHLVLCIIVLAESGKAYLGLHRCNGSAKIRNQHK